MSEERDGKGRFLTGNNGGGRPKGARSKLGERFLSDLLNDWEANGALAIQRMRESKPADYVRVVASLLPKELHVATNDLGDLSDSELADCLASVVKRLAELEGSQEDEAGSSSVAVH